MYSAASSVVNRVGFAAVTILSTSLDWGQGTTAHVGRRTVMAKYVRLTRSWRKVTACPDAMKAQTRSCANKRKQAQANRADKFKGGMNHLGNRPAEIVPGEWTRFCDKTIGEDLFPSPSRPVCPRPSDTSEVSPSTSAHASRLVRV